jgi:hypothetical protein
MMVLAGGRWSTESRFRRVAGGAPNHGFGGCRSLWPFGLSKGAGLESTKASPDPSQQTERNPMQVTPSPKGAKPFCRD